MMKTTSVVDADPAGSTRRTPWSSAVLIEDDADDGDGGVAVVGGALGGDNDDERWRVAALYDGLILSLIYVHA